ncbi:claudin-15b [Trichomycterus rosablanca]|uniref:claudin-15b n=1 Tax=Trichomycterus rosablanca TaxID=2290929 RepID=UPI002F3515B9
MRSAVQVCGLCLGFLGSVCAVVSLQVRAWKNSSDDGDVIITSKIYENLWTSCAEDSTGTFNCWFYPSVLALPAYIQACRALMITSVVLGALGVSATLVGMQCSKVGGENYRLKGRITALGGVAFILQGLCTMTAVSWYASIVVQTFFDPLHPGTRFEIGEGLYIGWCSAALVLIGGTSLLCTSGNADDEKW